MIIAETVHLPSDILISSIINLALTKNSNSFKNVSKEGYHEEKTETIAAQRAQRWAEVHEIIRVC